MPGNVIHINTAGGVPQINLGVTSSAQTTIATKSFKQVVGFVPLISCDYFDCRESEQNECYFNPVFGGLINGQPIGQPTYENDMNTFLVDWPLAGSSGSFIDIIIEKSDNLWYSPQNFVKWQWNAVDHIANSNCGVYYAPGSFASHPTYLGCAIDWGAVFANHGPGFYRIKFALTRVQVKIVIINGMPFPTISTTITECSVSEPFHLRLFNCEFAHGTTKFESWLTGSIGSIDEYYTRFDLCDISWYDSIRMKSFFGDETTPKYERTIVEYDTGLLERVRDKAIQNFKWRSNLLPKYVHDRFKAYGCMADTLLVSDYNYNNADYFINRKSVVLDSGYEPKYLGAKHFDKKMRYRQRSSYVEVTFREGVESVDKSLCCLPKC